MQGTRHPAADTAPQSTLASPALSLEDRLRGMIISHQQHHESRRRNQLEMAHHLPPQGNLTQQQQPHLPPSQVLPNMPPPQNAFSVAPPSLPVPFYLTPQLHPGLGMGAGATASPQLAVAQAPYRSHDGGTPRLVPTQPPLGRNARRPGLVHSYGPASRYPSCQNLASQNSPPPSNFDHFPPLGKEIPKEKQRPLNSVPTQRADQPRGQQPVGPGNRNTKSYQRRPAQALGHYEQFFAEQAFYLDQVTKRLLDKITPPDSAITAKHELLNSLELICKQLSPTAKLIPFGSLVTGFATASSDIDCVFSPGLESDEMTGDTTPDYPSLLERKLQDEGFEAQLLLRTRVPIIKMVQRESSGCLQEIQCDIGFKNHLAIHNTQLLLAYSKCDPRLKEMVLFIKWWAKTRHINSPYRGTLSSYGYVLMILHYLINVVSPPVLPNLQLQPVSQEDDGKIFYRDGGNEYNIWFSRDTQSILPSVNNGTLGELLRGFFDYYAYKFAWGQDVISIRTKGGLLTKQDKGWITAKSRPGITVDGSETYKVKDRYLFALEDPFETAHNVGRTCNRPGVGRIRDELRRAMRLIKNCGDRGNKLKEDLCEEAPPERPYLRREDRDHKGPKSPGDLPSNEKTANAKINQGTLLPALNMPAVEESLVTNTLRQAEDND